MISAVMTKRPVASLSFSVCIELLFSNSCPVSSVRQDFGMRPTWRERMPIHKLADMPTIARTLDDALAPITDGCVLAVPRESSGVPMAATRALIRRGVKRCT